MKVTRVRWIVLIICCCGIDVALVGATEDGGRAGDVLRTGKELSSSDTTGRGVEMKAYCRKVTRWKGDIERCSIDPVAGGQSAAVIITSECEGDTCEVHAWVVAANQKPRRVKQYEGGDLEVLPSGRAALIDRVHRIGGRWHVDLVAVDLRSGRAKPWADCMSPTLSPGKRWIVCRDEAGNVLRLPVGGGQPSMFYRSGFAPSEIEWRPEAADYPHRVSFPDADHMLVPTQKHDDKVEKVVPWIE